MNKKIIIAAIAVVAYFMWKKKQSSPSIALKPGDPGYKEAKAASQNQVS